MPWFPDFIGAAELARRQTRAQSRADPVGQYLTALSRGDTGALESMWPGEVVVHDPRAGEIRGHRRLRRFVRENQVWLAKHQVRIETLAVTCADDRAVMETLAYLGSPGGEVGWPVAVVAESPDDRSVVFRTYCSQWPVDGRRHLRHPILEPALVHPGDVVGRYLAALIAGDVGAALAVFAPDGYLREPIGSAPVHRGVDSLRGRLTEWLSAGGIGLQYCAMTDDGVRCAVEYNCVGWGDHELPAQAGLGIYERGPSGLLAAVRLYDDIEPPAARR